MRGIKVLIWDLWSLTVDHATLTFKKAKYFPSFPSNKMFESYDGHRILNKKENDGKNPK